MAILRHRQKFSFIIILFSILFIICSCGSASTTTGGASTQTPGVTGTAATTPTVSPTPIPPLATDCPAAGTARAAVMPALSVSNHATAIYVINGKTSGTLKSYDAATGQKKTILNVTPGYTPGIGENPTPISAARVSPDGQWVVFKKQLAYQQWALQLVRVDGQGLQTLYCMNNFRSLGVSWSPDQKYLAFSEALSPTAGPLLQILEVASGKLHTVIQASGISGQYEPIKWRDKTSLYLALSLTGIGGMSPQRDLTGLYLVQDVTKDQSQQSSNLQQLTISGIANSAHVWQDFDISPDNNQVVASHCSTIKGQTDPQIDTSGPSPISLQPVTGGSAQMVYQDQANAITYTRFLSNSSLLFTVNNYVWGNSPTSPSSPPSVDQNGLWRINTDGSGKTRIVATGDGDIIQFNETAYTTWENISRDNQNFAFVVRNTAGSGTFSLRFGTISGGTATTIDTASGLDYNTMILAGWTMM